MRNLVVAIVVLKLSATTVGLAQNPALSERPAAEDGRARVEGWPHWRGPTHDGVSTEKNLPETWSDTKGVAWKLPLPAYSGSTPIIWGDTIFLNVATGAHTGVLELWSIDCNKPAINWKRRLADANHREMQAEHVVALAGDRRQARLGDDGSRRVQGVRFRGQRNLGAQYPE